MPATPECYARIDNGLYDRDGEQWWRPDSAFHQFAVSFNPVRVGYARRKLLGDLHLDPHGKRALEVGCGGGVLSEEIRRMGFDVTGIDPSHRSLAAAMRHAGAGGMAIGYLRAAGEALPFPDGAYDVVFCCDVLEHVRDLPHVISEVARVLKHNGIFYYDTLNRNFISKLVAIKIAQQWRRWAFMPPGIHVWEMFIKPGEMKALLRQFHLDWKEHRGIKPDVPVLKLLGYLRRRAKGEWTYTDLGRRVHLVECRSTSLMYMGYAIKHA